MIHFDSQFILIFIHFDSQFILISIRFDLQFNLIFFTLIRFDFDSSRIKIHLQIKNQIESKIKGR